MTSYDPALEYNNYVVPEVFKCTDIISLLLIDRWTLKKFDRIWQLHDPISWHQKSKYKIFLKYRSSACTYLSVRSYNLRVFLRRGFFSGSWLSAASTRATAVKCVVCVTGFVAAVFFVVFLDTFDGFVSLFRFFPWTKLFLLSRPNTSSTSFASGTERCRVRAARRSTKLFEKNFDIPFPFVPLLQLFRRSLLLSGILLWKS